jgi:hypothetical protein
VSDRIVKIQENRIPFNVFVRLDEQMFCWMPGITCWQLYYELYFIPLVNASRLWIPEMDQIIEIMNFSV